MITDNHIDITFSYGLLISNCSIPDLIPSTTAELSINSTLFFSKASSPLDTSSTWWTLVQDRNFLLSPSQKQRGFYVGVWSASLDNSKTRHPYRTDSSSEGVSIGKVGGN